MYVQSFGVKLEVTLTGSEDDEWGAASLPDRARTPRIMGYEDNAEFNGVRWLAGTRARISGTSRRSRVGSAPPGKGPTFRERSRLAPSSVVIRAARVEDAESIATIYNEAVRTTTATFDTEPRTLVDQVDWLRRHQGHYPVLVAEADGQVVGWASLSEWSERRAYLRTAENSVYVDPAWRNQGVGRSLLANICKAGASQGLHTVIARIADGNAASLHLHESVGFRSIGVMREVGYKFGRLVDVHLMQLVFDRAGNTEPWTRPRPAPGSAVPDAPSERRM